MTNTDQNQGQNMKQNTLYCENIHPIYGVECHNWGPHDNCESYIGTDEIVHWSPNSLTDFGDRLVARTDDPSSSHDAAARDFDIPQGLRGMKVDILEALADTTKWLTCRQIAEAIYGPGPYTYEEAVGINKVQTVALNLWREGFVERTQGHNNVHGVLTYASKGTI